MMILSLLAQGESAAPGNIWQFNQAIFGSQESQPSGPFGFLETIRSGIGAAFEQSKFATPGGIISAVLPILLTLGGLIFFVMLVIGSFEILLGAAEPKSVEQGKKRITAALIGFLLLFASYWIGQLIQRIFGLSFGLM